MDQWGLAELATDIELVNSGAGRLPHRLLTELSDDPRSRAISCSLVCLGLEAPASQTEFSGRTVDEAPRMHFENRQA